MPLDAILQPRFAFVWNYYLLMAIVTCEPCGACRGHCSGVDAGCNTGILCSAPKTIGESERNIYESGTSDLIDVKLLIGWKSLMLLEAAFPTTSGPIWSKSECHWFIGDADLGKVGSSTQDHTTGLHDREQAGSVRKCVTGHQGNFLPQGLQITCQNHILLVQLAYISAIGHSMWILVNMLHNVLFEILNWLFIRSKLQQQMHTLFLENHSCLLTKIPFNCTYCSRAAAEIASVTGRIPCRLDDREGSM